jgi:hypothetical protein
LKDKRNNYEDLCLLCLAEALPEGAVVTILADRGLGDVKSFAFLNELAMTMSSGCAAISMSRRPMARPALPRLGRARKLPAASVTAGGREVGAVVCVHAKDMKEAWCFGHQPRRGERRRDRLASPLRLRDRSLDAARCRRRKPRQDHLPFAESCADNRILLFDAVGCLCSLRAPRRLDASPSDFENAFDLPPP